MSDNDAACRSLNLWLKNPKILQGIRYLTIKGYCGRRGNGSKENDHWPLIIELLTKLSNLKVCEYKVCYQPPLLFLETLHKSHPKASLRLFNYERKNVTMGPDDPAELALGSSPALVTFSGSIWTGGHDDFPDLREAAMRRIIAMAPNLRFASISKGHSGCVVRGYSNEQLQAQREKERPFKTTRPSNSLRTLHLDGFGACEQTLKDWGNLVDLTCLEKVKCSRGVLNASFFQAAPTLLPNLSQLSVNFSRYHGGPTKDIAVAAQTYLITCSPLRCISLWSWNDFVPVDVILRHGPKLESLELHEREMCNVEPPRRLLSIEEIAMIRDSCPVLREFTLDIDRETVDGTEEIDNPRKYAELAAFPQVSRIQLYFDLGIAWKASYNPLTGLCADPLSPSEDDHSAEDGSEKERRQFLPPSTPEHAVPYVKNLWRRLFATRSAGARQLDIKNGEVERKMGSGYPAPWVIWESHRSSHWRVLPNERDDMKDEPVLTVIKGQHV